MSPVSIVAYLALFSGLGIAFLFGNLLVGRFLRPDDPHAEKLEVYECGEPTIGSSFVQFDLRFYVVALLFIIFDVEVAFFFPWATVFGKATHLMDPAFTRHEARQTDGLVQAKFGELGVPNPTMDNILASPAPGVTANATPIADLASDLALMSMLDILVFFAVLMVGFFYVWRRGDLDWVRALGRERASPVERPIPEHPAEKAPALSV
jgi:NADH-quinone oxidoreductase subunit A